MRSSKLQIRLDWGRNLLTRHLDQRNPTSEVATVGTVDSSRFGRRTAAALEAAGRGCRRLVDSVEDVHTLLIGWARGLAGLDLQTALVA